MLSKISLPSVILRKPAHCSKALAPSFGTFVNSFLDFAKAVKNLESPAESSFYYYDGVYRLLLDSPVKALCIMAKEFSLSELDYIGFADKTREAFNCLIESDALKILGGLFSEE